MTLRDYLKGRKGFLAFNVLLVAVCVGFLLILEIDIRICIGIAAIWLCPLWAYIILQFVGVKKYYDELTATFEQLEEKYLLAEVVDAPSFAEGDFFYHILRASNKAMHERVNHYEGVQQAYKEYIEGWIHEIKTPIAGIHLIIDNNEAPALSKVAEEIKKIEAYVEQALYYARSNDVHKDYMIKSFMLRQVVMEVLKNNSKMMIQKGMFPQMEGLEEVVYSDAKWITFILNQILTNSVKYTEKPKSTLKIKAVKKAHAVLLELTDEGIGIDEKELGKVFDKGFTGEKGRKYREATGMGLYLSKKLCDKLGVGIEIQSTQGIGTKVTLIFPLSRLEDA